MKKRILQFTVVCATLFASCNKEKVSPELTQTQENQSSAKDVGITVKDGRLRFSDVEKLNELITMDRDQKSKVLRDVQNFPGFTSKREKENNQSRSKTSSSCDCAIEDNFINSIIDENNMLEIGEWTVKLDACDPQKRTYAFYRALYNPGEVTLRVNAMKMCDYNSSFGFFAYLFDIDVLEELEISGDSINGNPNGAKPRCQDVVCSDRSARVEPIMGWFDGPTLNGAVQPETPVLRLKYEKGWLTTGRTNVYMEYSNATPADFGAYRFEFDQTCYKQKCKSTITRSSGLETGIIDSPDPDQTFNEYSDKRLKAGFGSVKVRARKNDSNLNFWSPWAEILF